MSRRKTREMSLAMADWPAADQAMWRRLFADGSPLDERGPLAHLKDASRVALREHYAKWLHRIATTMPDLVLAAPADRVTAERLHHWMSERHDLAPMSRLMIVSAVLRLVMNDAPERDWSPEVRLRHHLQRRARGQHGARKTGRIVSSQLLLEAALMHASDAPAEGETAIRARTRQRDAALVAFLALMPIRARACSELALGSSLLDTGRALLVVLSEDMTKNGQPWEAPVPDVIAPLLRHYIDTVRPWLMGRHGQTHDRVWVGDRGQPIPPGYLGRRMAELTERLVGVRIPAHFFRDCAATTLARTAPAEARLIRPLLGHLDFATADRHYIQAEHVEAGRDHAAVLARLRRTGR